MLALIGLHLKPPVRELTRNSTAVEARTLARAQRLTLRALPRVAAAGPIGRAALAFAVADEPPAGGDGSPPPEARETPARLRRLVRGLARLRVVESVSVLVRPAGTRPAPDLPTVEVEADAFLRGADALLPDRLYVVADRVDEEPPEPPRALGRPVPRALPAGPRQRER